jgi:hypothetical protein
MCTMAEGCCWQEVRSQCLKRLDATKRCMPQALNAVAAELCNTQGSLAHGEMQCIDSSSVSTQQLRATTAKSSYGLRLIQQVDAVMLTLSPGR